MGIVIAFTRLFSRIHRLRSILIIGSAPLQFNWHMREIWVTVDGRMGFANSRVSHLTKAHLSR